ncbi:hypothetical protein [Dethiosulfatibacter aminovorans]
MICSTCNEFMIIRQTQVYYSCLKP